MSLTVRVVALIVLVGIVFIGLVGAFILSQVRTQLFDRAVTSGVDQFSSTRLKTQRTINSLASPTAGQLQQLANELVLSQYDPVQSIMGGALLRSRAHTSASSFSIAEPSTQSSTRIRTLISAEMRDSVRGSSAVHWQSVALSNEKGRTVPGIVVGGELNLPGAGTYEFYVAYSLESEMYAIQLMTNVLTVGAIVLLLFIAIATGFVVRMVLQPVREASKNARLLSEGGFDARMAIKGEDELAQLARSFNQMASSLSDQFEQLDRMSKVQQEFVSAVSHELRSPVQTIRKARELICKKGGALPRRLRVDAAASMLYLDYSRKEGQWHPNQFGGREHLEAISFLQEATATAYRKNPGIIMAAEESTAWPGVTAPTEYGGLGFGLKWNMGWMNDTLRYFEEKPVNRKWHHSEITFSLVYAFSEHFLLPLSHDEVVHGKGSLYAKMPGDDWQKLAGVRELLAYQWSHPGKKLLFMGQEFAQTEEWNESAGLQWWLTNEPSHDGVLSLVRRLNEVYREHPALWSDDFTNHGFEWIDGSDGDHNVISYLRRSADEEDILVVVCNFAGIPHGNYRVGLPFGGQWDEIVNTDALAYGGTGGGKSDAGAGARGVASLILGVSLEVVSPSEGMTSVSLGSRSTSS